MIYVRHTGHLPLDDRMASNSFGPNWGIQVGQNYGPINNLPPERPETPPNPSAVIPFPRDTDFVKRDAILGQIHHNFAVPGSWTALVGLGGVG